MARIDDIIEAEDSRLVAALAQGQRASAADARMKRQYAQWLKDELIASGDLQQSPDRPRKPKPRRQDRKEPGRGRRRRNGRETG